jgi:hypothetical protein
MNTLTVATFKWQPPPGYRSIFGPKTVNVLRRMVARFYPQPHRFVCITDDPDGLDAGIEVVPIWPDYANLPSPHGNKNPSCYRRLKLFSPDIESVLGRRFVSLDLDCVIVGDLTPLWHRDEDFVIWGDYTNPKTIYNGSMMLHTAGARRQVWDRFDPRTSPAESKNAGAWGSDQGFISYCLGPHEARWTKADGVYSYRNEIVPNRFQKPDNARIVFFHGRVDPWSPEAQGVDWIREAWS